ncbi:MAG: DUF1232 domain-containing protein [Rhodospirillales bacterium]|nr:DUF1232 domain-containing protein [Rhodospirillales bacterium]
METPDLSQALVPVAGQESYVRRRFWGKLRRTLGRMPFADRAVAAYYAALDPATPKHAKAVLLAALAYFIMPADLIPDIIAGLGFSDDAAVLLMALQTLSAHVTPEHVARAREALDAEG